jgi:hypothetical protein
MRHVQLALAMSLLTACTSPTPGILETTMPSSTREYFTYCTGYGCSQRWNIVITEEEWDTVRAIFSRTPASAEDERRLIAEAIGQVEQIIGPKAHTSDDEAGAAIVPMGSTRGQLDCIDESHNTHMFLSFMDEEGYFIWHDLGPVAKRGMVFDRWFHNTAVVVEKDTGDSYVIDSWFGLNGAPADVVALDVWMEGWHPEGFVNGATRQEIEQSESTN